MAHNTSLRDELTSTRNGMLLWQQEKSILEVTEMLCALMQRIGVSRSELARRLKTTKGYISQLLDGETNMTVRTISDVLTVLGYEFVASARPVNSQDDFAAVSFDVQAGVSQSSAPTSLSTSVDTAIKSLRRPCCA